MLNVSKIFEINFVNIFKMSLKCVLPIVKIFSEDFLKYFDYIMRIF